MNDRPDMRDTEGTVSISIGAMSRATGIPANTLRTWERRYGFPLPDRTESGQRVYDPALIGHLRLVARALEVGHRPSQVLSIPRAQLAELVGGATHPAPLGSGANEIEDWILAAQGLDGRSLDNGFRTEAARLGLLRFLTERVGPFLIAVGEAWSDGELEVYQEHWASERLRRFLEEAWEPLAQDATGPIVTAATLPGDRHDLGLHMAVAVMAMSGWRIVFLGRETPVPQIAAATHQGSASATLLSITAWADPSLTLGHLRELRARLTDDQPILIGGAGAPRGDVPGVSSPGTLDGLYRWASGER